MEGCIVSPFTIYVLGVVDALLVTSIVATVICFIVAFCCLMGDEIEISKKSFRIAIVALILAIFVPSKNTIIGMVVAKNITYENVAKGTDVAKQSIDYIFDKIQTINNKED